MAETSHAIITLTREQVEDISESLWSDLSVWPNEWDQYPSPYRDTITWWVPEPEFLILVLKHPELLDFCEEPSRMPSSWTHILGK